jgi:uncharacterized phage-associated protein
MTSVLDVASYILEKDGATAAMKLQKLCYYSQAWSLVWDEKPIFKEPIEAWANGPVVMELFKAHRGQFTVSTVSGNSSVLTREQKDTIDQVCEFYSKYNSQQLSDLTHMEKPWQVARKGLEPGERGNNEIGLDQMAAYYASIRNV